MNNSTSGFPTSCLYFTALKKLLSCSYVRIDMAQGHSSASPAQDSEGIKSMEEGEVIRK